MNIFGKKKKNLLVKKKEKTPSRQSVCNQIEQSIKIEAKRLSDDFNKPLSGTGTPIEKLKGNAKRNAQLANAGGGSKANGGGGVDMGIERVMDLARKIGRKEGIEVAERLPKK